ncbi:uncharacterized protein T551_00561 [Pneumocystis jirovecii RU7]|uniref:Uncharacterized protein n=1 Tax=Pneumocystis jirovecii (strain RU7) TaxID=1408657 RepID=A0A0W4ZVS4_PNEJ7|nr:uncharacterized protein T551_00561 [Pneumocystis jirovecii RU7]KTW32471.1 hypothetical protein T551_00561 [Pneumocystis jirovecii RU7]
MNNNFFLKKIVNFFSLNLKHFVNELDLYTNIIRVKHIQIVILSCIYLFSPFNMDCILSYRIISIIIHDLIKQFLESLNLEIFIIIN